MVSEQHQREIDQYVASTPRAAELHKQAMKYLPGGSTRGVQYFPPYPFVAERGEGLYIYDVDGNRYLDYVINATSLILGHAHPKVVKAIQDKASLGTAFSVPTEDQTKLARVLCERIPSVETLRFTNSGTEGTLMAIRAARAFTGKHKIAKFEGGYHGSHEYAEISVHPSADKLDPNEITSVPQYPGQPPSISEDVIVMPYNDLEACERIIRQHKDDLSCVIMEAISSSFGYLPANVDFLSGIRDLTMELGILLIFDEVQSLRVAPGGAQELLGVTPDLTCMGKIIGGGTPVGAFGGREDVMALYDPTENGPTLGHSGTFNGNPLTMAAGAVVMNEMTPDVYQQMSQLGETLRSKLRAVFDELDIPAQVTGVASLFGIHFTSEEIVDYRSTLSGDKALKGALSTGLLNEGVMLGGALSKLTTETEVDTFVDSTRRVIQRVRQ
jgi:glutamate-1-semialdehyde 2,1-aminomutase